MGFGHNAVLPYLPQAKKLGASDIIYIGHCVATAQEYSLRAVVLAEGGDSDLLKRACLTASQYGISALPHSILGCDGIVDFATETIYAGARECDLAALSILTVSENSATGERMEEHERRSRFYAASRLAFETLATNH